MEGWIVLWKAVFILGMAVFVAMAAWVTVQGFRDIRALFATLSRGRRKSRRR